MNIGQSRRTPTQVKLLTNSTRLESRKNRLKRVSNLTGSPHSFLETSVLGRRIKIEYENHFNQYEFSLNLYAVPPFGHIDLAESQQAVEERLKILSVFDDIKAEQARSKVEFNFNTELTARLKSLHGAFINEVSGGKENVKVQAARRRDHVSHFLLRLLCCQTDELKKWFIQKEVELLRYRLDSDKNTIDIVNLLIYNNLHFQELDIKEKQLLLKQNKINYNNPKTMVSSVFYKIPFEEALELVRTRRVFLQDGFCYCSSAEMVTIICSKFRLELSRSLANLHNSLPQLSENNRLQPIFMAICDKLIKARKTNRTMDGNKEQVTPDMIDELAATSFPPCMRNAHELLRLNHHLKHYGRLHYGLFLKGIGLTLDDALVFFREEFIQSMTPERFQKEHSYNIRYNYGKEGKRVNLSAFSCAKIINGNAPGIGDSHGCPFKHFDNNNLIKMLKKHNIDEENVKEIVELSKQQKHTSACSCYFTCKNKNYQLPQEVYHPNQYYTESRRVAKNLHLVQPTVEPNNQTNTDENTVTNDEINMDMNDDFDFDLDLNIETNIETNTETNADTNAELHIETNTEMNAEQNSEI